MENSFIQTRASRAFITSAIVASMVAGIIGFNAWAQPTEEDPGAAKEIVIDEAQETVEPEVKEEKNTNRPRPAMAPRDPFFSPVSGGFVAPPEEGSETTEEEVTEEVAEEEVIEVIEPAFTVAGIIFGDVRYAIVNVDDSRSWIVRTGDCVDDYRVTGIGDRYVDFSYNESTFRLAMSEEYPNYAAFASPYCGGKGDKGNYFGK